MDRGHDECRFLCACTRSRARGVGKVVFAGTGRHSDAWVSGQ